MEKLRVISEIKVGVCDDSELWTQPTKLNKYVILRRSQIRLKQKRVLEKNSFICSIEELTKKQKLI